MVGHLSVNIPAGPAGFEFGIGISIVNQEVVDGGGTDIPLPLTDTNQSWYYWEAQIGRIRDDETMVFPKFDIRTSRKVRTGFALILVFETGPAHGATTPINFQARALWTAM